MAKVFEVVDAEHSVSLTLPPRQRVAVVTALAIATPAIGFGVLWWGYQWLASTNAWWAGISEISMAVLLLVETVAIRVLMLELAATILTFERTTIGIGKRLFRISISRRWYSCYRIAEFRVTPDITNIDRLRLEFLTSTGRMILVGARIPSDCFVQLVHLLRRKGYAYLQQEPSNGGD